MAPEQIRSDGRAEGTSDLFAVGVVLYEARPGSRPSRGGTPAASLAAVLEAHVDPDPRSEPRLWVEVARAIAKRPYERHASANELAVALRAAVDETEGSLAAPFARTLPTPIEDDELPHAPGPATIGGHALGAKSGARRMPWLAWACGGVAAGAAVAVTIAVLPRQRATAPVSNAATAESAPAQPAAALTVPVSAATDAPSATTPASTTAPRTSAPLPKPSTVPHAPGRQAAPVLVGPKGDARRDGDHARRAASRPSLISDRRPQGRGAPRSQLSSKLGQLVPLLRKPRREVHALAGVADDVEEPEVLALRSRTYLYRPDSTPRIWCRTGPVTRSV